MATPALPTPSPTGLRLDAHREIRHHQPGARRLVVLLHAYTLQPESLSPIADLIRAECPDSDVIIPWLPVQNPFAMTDPEQLARAIADRIDEAWKAQAPTPYRDLILLGHSLGALLARKVYLIGWQEHRAWFPAVERLVLLAAMNRGWTPSHHLGFWTGVTWLAGRVLGRATEITQHLIARIFGSPPRTPIIFTIRRGAKFITQLQLEWLAMLEALGVSRPSETSSSSPPQPALTIQLLGTVDDMVSPEDNIDLVTGANFVYLDVPGSGHADIIRINDTSAGKARRDPILLALTGSPERLRQESVHPSDALRAAPRSDVTDVVFVIHGIRDVGYWTQKIARRVQALARKEEVHRLFATETSTYGYFPMLPFLLPGTRRAKVQWLMDQYVAAKARYPKAEFSYVGHSNGTYLLARALEDYPLVRFKHVVFAGSVVRRRFPWDRLLPGSGTGQVQGVLNFVATADWVVAWFPKLFQVLRLHKVGQDLGSAGHDGFAESPQSASRVRNIRYATGQHSAALSEGHWDTIARFIVEGSCDREPGGRPVGWIKALGMAPYFVWATLAAGIALGFWGLMWGGDPSPAKFLSETWPTHQATVLRLGAVALYVWVIKTVLTRL